MIATTLLALLALPLGAITAFFAVEVAVGLPRMRSNPSEAGTVSAVVIVPAHDEEVGIGATLAALQAAATGIAAILVVADNCHDRTAEIARSARVQVTERSDNTKRGKGYALAHAQQYLTAAPPDVVVVLDADCSIERESLAALISAAHRLGRPIQAVNLVRPDPSAGPLVALSTFAFMLKNLVRQRGLQRLAGTVHLTGTGMALPWPLFASASLASANIVEDLKLGLDLARREEMPRLEPAASVWSAPARQSEALRQRSRWEGGFIATALQTVPMLIGDALRNARPSWLILALDLCIPPLALLVAVDTLMLLVILALFWMTGMGAWIAGVLLLAMAAAVAAILAAWLTEGRKFIRLSQLAAAPFYVLWKLPMYLAMLRKGTPGWLRTGR